MTRTVGKLLLSARAAAALVVGCTVAGTTACAAAGADTAHGVESQNPGLLTQSGTLAEPGQADQAYTYNTELAPVGARVSVSSRESHGQTSITVAVEGLVPARGYAAHAHSNACGATGDAAGPHFQKHPRPPDAPQADPTYVNPANEVWFELDTNQEGDAADTTTVPFEFTDRAPNSVVLHSNPQTASAPGAAGAAGARVACLTVPFK